MKQFLSLAAGLAAVALSARAAEAPRAEAPPPYAMVEAMIGGLWSTTIPAQDGIPARTVEMRFTQAENQQGVFYQSWTVAAGKRTPLQNGIYAWNPAKGKVEFFCTDARGGLTEGSYAAAAGGLTGDFTVYNRDGSADPVHTQVARVSADLITEQIFLPKDDGWAKASELRLERRR